jgi:hypothetical protein
VNGRRPQVHRSRRNGPARGRQSRHSTARRRRTVTAIRFADSDGITYATKIERILAAMRAAATNKVECSCSHFTRARFCGGSTDQGSCARGASQRVQGGNESKRRCEDRDLLYRGCSDVLRRKPCPQGRAAIQKDFESMLRTGLADMSSSIVEAEIGGNIGTTDR